MERYCKQGITVTVKEPDGKVRRLRGVYHPAGCMGAHYPHLDLEPKGLLAELAKRRGLNLRCIQQNSGVLLVEQLSGVTVEISAEGYTLLCSQRFIRLMRTRSGMLYVQLKAKPHRRKNT